MLLQYLLHIGLHTVSCARLNHIRYMFQWNDACIEWWRMHDHRHYGAILRYHYSGDTSGFS